MGRVFCQEMVLEDFRALVSEEVPNEVVSNRVMGMLLRVCRWKLPASFDAQLDLDRFLAITPTHQIYQNALVIRNGLKGHQVREALGVTKESFRVYRTYFNKFLDQVEKYFRPSRAPNEPDLSDAWHELIEKVRLLETPKIRLKITAFKRFASFCEERKKGPEAVDAMLVESFRDYLRNESGLKVAVKYYRTLFVVWQGLVVQGDVQEVTFLPWNNKSSQYGLTWDALPDVSADVFRHFESLATSEDPDERIVKAPLQASTLNTYRATYLDYMGYLVNEVGIALDQMPETDFFKREYIEGFHKFALARSEGIAMLWHVRRLYFLRQFIRIVVIPFYGDVDINWIEGVLSKTTSHEKRQQAPEYSRDQVDQVLNHLNVRLNVVQEDNYRKLIPLHTARFAITFLADHPLRGKNLREAHLGREFSDDGRSFRLRTKNEQIVESHLSQASWQALQDYLAIRKRAGIYSTSVLVSRTGKPMSQSGLYAIIASNFKKGAGVHFSPHCFRYLAVGQALERTGDINYAGAAIGDRSGRVVEKSYNRYSANQAGRIWFALNDAFRKDRVGALSPPLQKLLERARSDVQLKTLLKDILFEEVEDHVKQA